ncbi:spherulation-specific family 4 protein [Acidovorax sp.]|uniref:spherulation-specific family 4 protein n=1 Tax=Acidovorax sp. TaxID=1872122 RepID=UPI00262F7899|nr:spherulation-specific family 4 protein [Acidovorax sp.]
MPTKRLPRSARAPARWSLLSLAGLIAACGGGGGGGDTPPPANVAIQFTAPAAEEAYTAGSALALSARVTENGANVADGTSVHFSTGTGPATTGRTVAGTAAASLTGVGTGRQQVQASTTVAGSTASAVLTLYLRPVPSSLEVLVPAYFAPTGAGAPHWAAMTSGAAATPAVKITAILNPADGPSNQADANTRLAATQFVAAGGKLVGYVFTGYGTGGKSLAAIKAEIDAYFTFYGRDLISGIFLDEMAATDNRLDFYRELYRYIKAKDASLRVIGNPGMLPTAGYATVADVLTVFEGKSSQYSSYNPRTPDAEWTYARPNGSLATLVHNTATCAAMQTAVQASASARYNMGMVYVTHREYEFVTNTGNPWLTLPTYWTDLLQTVRAVNVQQALPACS